MVFFSKKQMAKPKIKTIKKRNLHLHLILVSKSSSGASGKHTSKDKKERRKILKVIRDEDWLF